MKRIVIVGAGLAGYSVARELRKLDQTSSLTIITADSGAFYSKPMLSNALALSKDAKSLATQSGQQMAEQLHATIVSMTRVLSIDSKTRVVRTERGEHEYDDLILAPGAQAIRLPLKGEAASAVMSINHLQDYDSFRQQLALRASFGPVRIAILGAGLIGCEFADDLSGAGHHVTLIDPNARPMAALAAPSLSDGLQQALETRGVRFALNNSVISVDYQNYETGDLHLSLADGSSLETDLVVSAVGLRPTLDLAKSAGLATERGIIVDRYGRTSASNIYALGDCAEYTLDNDQTTRLMPYIAPLMNAARAIAKTIDGTPTMIDLKASPVVIKTPSYPMALIAPKPEHRGAWIAQQEGERLITRFLDGEGQLRGFGVAPQDAATRQKLLSEFHAAHALG